jgi:hypothetical protein
MVQCAILSLVVKTTDHYVMLTLDSYVTTTKKFNLWMFRSGHDTFTLVINFINSQWVHCHVTMGLFEATNMAKITMVM